MKKLPVIIDALQNNPSYTLMRGVARFETVRKLVTAAVGLANKKQLTRFRGQLEPLRNESPFRDIDRSLFVKNLDRDGIAFGLDLPESLATEIRNWALAQPCYADRNSKHGFYLSDKEKSETYLGKPILLSQYFNTISLCAPIRRLSEDPVIIDIAASYLGAVPKFVGASLWWTFPVEASPEDRSKHAHVYHRDVDDFKFLKFFFYLTDVPKSEGAHICVAGSHTAPPSKRISDPWLLRRYEDDEICDIYDKDSIKEICGTAGTGFAENTLCVHKGSTPKNEPRLILQFQFALFDYGVMNDNCSPKELQILPM
jgi:hypothetical protein